MGKSYQHGTKIISAKRASPVNRASSPPYEQPLKGTNIINTITHQMKIHKFSVSLSTSLNHIRRITIRSPSLSSFLFTRRIGVWKKKNPGFRLINISNRNKYTFKFIIIYYQFQFKNFPLRILHTLDIRFNLI